MRKSLVPIIAAGLFAVSLCLPTADFVKGCGDGLGGWGGRMDVAGERPGAVETLSGWEILLYGPIGLLVMQPGALGWLANPLGAVALVLRRRSRRASRGLAASGLLLAAVSLWLTDLFPLPTDADAVCHLAAVGPRVGYWIWLAALAVAAANTWTDTGGRHRDGARAGLPGTKGGRRRERSGREFTAR